MKYSDSVKIEPKLVDADIAGQIVGKRILFERCVKAGWIAPVVDRHSCKLFSKAKVDECAHRIILGDYPDSEPA